MIAGREVLQSGPWEILESSEQHLAGVQPIRWSWCRVGGLFYVAEGLISHSSVSCHTKA